MAIWPPQPNLMVGVYNRAQLFGRNSNRDTGYSYFNNRYQLPFLPTFNYSVFIY